jgi:hypothetical protein
MMAMAKLVDLDVFIGGLDVIGVIVYLLIHRAPWGDVRLLVGQTRGCALDP